MRNLEILIARYIDKAEACATALRAHCGGMHPVRAWRERKISAQGEIEGPEKCCYSMHGIGCLFTADQWAVDVDFNAHGECGGFDAWRLAHFAKSQSLDAQWPLPRIESEVRALTETRLLQPVGDSPCKHLLQLAAPTPDSPPS